MQKVERVKLFIGGDAKKLEKQYAEWYDSVVEGRNSVPALKGNPFKIIERSLVIKNYEGAETFALAVFYEDTLLEDHERGGDRGGHLKGGVSMMGHRR